MFDLVIDERDRVLLIDLILAELSKPGTPPHRALLRPLLAKLQGTDARRFVEAPSCSPITS